MKAQSEGSPLIECATLLFLCIGADRLYGCRWLAGEEDIDAWEGPVEEGGMENIEGDECEAKIQGDESSGNGRRCKKVGQVEEEEITFMYHRTLIYYIHSAYSNLVNFELLWRSKQASIDGRRK